MEAVVLSLGLLLVPSHLTSSHSHSLRSISLHIYTYTLPLLSKMVFPPPKILQTELYMRDLRMSSSVLRHCVALVRTIYAFTIFSMDFMTSQLHPS